MLGGLLWLIWHRELSRAVVVVRPSSVVVSWILVLCYFGASITLSPRDNSALVNEGLSGRNMAQVAVVGCISLWAAYLVCSRTIGTRTLVRGQNFWILAQSLVFLATTLWSVWPALTAYRAVELVACWVLLVHLYGRGQSWENTFFWLFFIAEVPPLLLPRALSIQNGFTWGLGGKSANGSFLAASLVVILAGQWLYGIKPVGRARALLVCVSLALSSSLGSAIALLFSLIILVAWRLPRMIRTWAFATCGAVLCLLTLGALLSPVRGLAFSLANTIGEALGRDTRNMQNLTGRLPLWTAILEYSKDMPFGTGYAAGERVFGTLFANHSEVGWNAINAHNGYISAWVAAGWAGVVLLAGMLLAACTQIARCEARYKASGMALLVLAAVNNCVIPVTSTEFGPGWLLLISLAMIPSYRKSTPLGGASPAWDVMTRASSAVRIPVTAK